MYFKIVHLQYLAHDMEQYIIVLFKTIRNIAWKILKEPCQRFCNIAQFIATKASSQKFKAHKVEKIEISNFFSPHS